MSKLNFEKWKDDIVESLELPKDLVYGAVLVTITGQQEVLVENYRGILEYNQTQIRLQTKNCKLLIQGKNLYILYYTNEEMKITGIIDSVTYET